MVDVSQSNLPRARVIPAFALMMGLAQPAWAQTEEQDSLKILFATNSATVSADGNAVLDQASRLFRDGNPIVMIVAGGADTVGQADYNLQLSVRRAEAVAQGLTDRGIPADRLQVLGRGTSELPVPTDDETATPENRVVEISWR